MTEPSAPLHEVFVYGTLLRGLRNHHWLRGASFIREDKTAEPFVLVDLGEYPAVLQTFDDFERETPGGPVSGEVWRVDDEGFALLDQLEGYPWLYTRRIVPLKSGARAWLYLLNGAPEEHGMQGDVIPSGDYRAWLSEGDF